MIESNPFSVERQCVQLSTTKKLLLLRVGRLGERRRVGRVRRGPVGGGAALTRPAGLDPGRGRRPGLVRRGEPGRGVDAGKPERRLLRGAGVEHSGPGRGHLADDVAGVHRPRPWVGRRDPGVRCAGQPLGEDP